MKGKLITLEGADGSGKGTQFHLLLEYCRIHNIPFETMDFPRYEGSFFGELAGRLLSGQLGKFEEIPAELAALPFACDRWLLKDQLMSWLDQGKLVISNRYTASSAVYQAAKKPKDKQQAFVDWVYRLEQEVIGLPKEDVVIYLHMPLSMSQSLIEKKGKREYLGEGGKDEYEIRSDVQRDVGALYDELTRTHSHWKKITCAVDNVLRAPTEIHKDIVDELIRFGVL